MKLKVRIGKPSTIKARLKKPTKLRVRFGNVRITSEGYTPPTYEGATEVTPTKASQTLETDGYYVKADIKVNPIPNEYIVPEGVKEITQNGTYDITDKKTAEVNVPIPDGYHDASGISTDPSKVLVGNEYVNAFGRQVGTMPNNSRIQTTLSYEKASEVIIPEGYHPEGYVRVDFQDKTVTPTKSTQSVTPGKGLTLGRVTVNPIPDEYIIPSGTKDIDSNGVFNVNDFQKVNVQVEAEIPEGYVELPTLTNEGTAADVLMGKELIDSKGQVVSGLIPIRTASNLTASGATVTVPPGCYEDTVSKSVATATQATPSISVSTAGKITASATQSAGYVSSGTKSATKQLTTQAAKTVTPTKSSQTAVASQRYTTGAITVAPIPDEYIIPSGTKAITENGTHDVTEFAEVNVSIEGKENLDEVLSAQEALIEELKAELQGKASGGGGAPDPSALYQRISFIESTTGCQIVTDVFADNETGIELLAEYPTLADRVAMGSRLDSNATRFYAPYPLSANSFYYGFNSGVTKSTGAVANRLYRSSLNFLNSRVATVKEENTNAVEFADMLTSTLSQNTAPIGIFCYLRNVDGEYALQSSRDIIFYGARISQGGDIIREYIPCYRKSDWEIGLYEKYTGAFLTNEGSGTFTAGDDIEW